MFTRFMVLLLAGYALGRWDGSWGHRRRELRHARIAPKAAEVTTWEGEGGALRGTGSQLGPDPLLP